MKEWLETGWTKRVSQAVKNKSFTESDIRLAQLWITGPLSEFEDDGVIDFKEGQLHKGPVDLRLVLEGIWFSKAVEDGNVALAKICFDNIHARITAIHKDYNRRALLGFL